MTCPFCRRIADGPVEERTELACAFPDGYPVSPGHTLVVSRRHEADFTRLTPAERQAIWLLSDAVCDRLRRDLAPDGFNLGVNVGAAAGQTVAHAHLHVIPRYAGDADDPRGGVRWVLPAGAKYW